MGGQSRYRSGHPPHDAINGLRVGAVAGGVAGAAAVWIFSVGAIWPVLIAAVAGGTYGYITGRHKARPRH